MTWQQIIYNIWFGSSIENIHLFLLVFTHLPTWIGVVSLPPNIYRSACCSLLYNR